MVQVNIMDNQKVSELIKPELDSGNYNERSNSKALCDKISKQLYVDGSYKEVPMNGVYDYFNYAETSLLKEIFLNILRNSDVILYDDIKTGDANYFPDFKV